MFTVTRASSVEQVRFCYELATREIGYDGGANNPEAFYAADPTGTFIGELNEAEDGSGNNDKHLSAMNVTKYDDSYAYIGFYAVEKAYRGQGYGLQTFKAGLASVGEGCAVALDSIESMVSTYERSGFKHAWIATNYRVTVSKILEGDQHQVDVRVAVVPLDETNLEMVAAYDGEVFGFSRRCFVEAYLSADTSRAFTALDHHGKVVGYIVVQKCMRGSTSRVGPFFADDVQTARTLLHAMVHRTPPDILGASFIVRVPTQPNPAAKKFMEEELCAEFAVRLIRMYTKTEPPNVPWLKVFAFTELG